MDNSQFIGRSELLAWVNELLELKLTKIEQCCNGAVYLQLMDVIYPGKVPLGKIKWNSSLEYEHIHNYKLLQNVFKLCSISKHINVQGLIKGRCQDNLEFLQWMKHFVDTHHDSSNKYDGLHRRISGIIKSLSLNKKILSLVNVKNSLPKWAIMNTITQDYIDELSYKVDSPNSKGDVQNNQNNTNTCTLSQTPTNTQEPISTQGTCTDSEPLEYKDGFSDNNADTNPKDLIESLNLELKKQNEEVKTLKRKLHEAQKENHVYKLSKDFYYNKLRKIEILCQKNKGENVETKLLFDIMYSDSKT
ncbi:conserved hypothetical protein [Theileria equi strain WA]|uniref:Uncharacterized protein n=1 Tax=Theileria equi strain WA TaxID=1537102 RepID=L1LD63_THEEQ|nr:conserved hypothetical protein [Theileria equi strain WA]EKX73195.1 conserved hypothetical protein [Theileria equi strain WA]|eukprot:XP_004832647.1 conserved hypothetical protein [Theileria equi strain WA]